ncbi:MAG: FAD:protein FMN transferase [Balneola sp.]|nr:MAG: FAD:protein FMN transferase [Balneola sp.]
MNMKIKIASVVLLLLALSCTKQQESKLVVNTGNAQGSTFQVRYLTTSNQNFEEDINNIFRSIDQSMSTYLPGSLISQLNSGDVELSVDDHFRKVLDRALEISEETDGDFDPTVGVLVSLWGFGFEEVRADVDTEMIEAALEKTGFEKIRYAGGRVSLPDGVSLDFNAIAQGYTVDAIAGHLESKGIEHYMVEVGGEVKTLGVNEKGNLWRIGIDKPKPQIDDESRFQVIVEMENNALATSGNYRRYWVDEASGLKYSHTINPHTGTPARNRLLSVSVLAPTSMDADAYATVCMVKGVEGCMDFLEAKPELEGYLVFTDDQGEWKVLITEGFEKYILE